MARHDRPPMDGLPPAPRPASDEKSDVTPQDTVRSSPKGVSFPHSYSSVPDPGQAALNRDRLQASAVIECLMRAARDGQVFFNPTAARVDFVFQSQDDARFVFEAITGRPSPRVWP